jgi:uncharacterized HAD superfamily protein/adenine/guanine phosphoribosyltransferase-like PRPP-binding protein
MRLFGNDQIAATFKHAPTQGTRMNYRSLHDMNSIILQKLDLIPVDIDLVVGIPRSGLLAANIVALALNVPLADLAGFLENRRFESGTSRKVDKNFTHEVHESKHVLVIDDSVGTGHSIERVKRKIREAGLDERIKITYAAIYVSPGKENLVDLSFETVPMPRVFDWNVLHTHLGDACVDIDGVLCVDPTRAENDDSSNYIHFLKTATCLIKPKVEIGYLVTSRLEKYRPETEEWLHKNGIKFRELYMLDLPNAEARQRIGAHAQFKAKIFKQTHGARLFIESEEEQAKAIASLSGKHAYCARSGIMYGPNIDHNFLISSTFNAVFRIKRKIKEMLYSISKKQK